LGRLIPAVLRGDVKPKTAHTVAYLMQTFMKAIHLSKHEYINAFGTDAWRQSVRNSVTCNHDYLFPPDPAPEPPPDEAPVVAGLQTGADQGSQPASPLPQPVETPVNCHSERCEEPAFSSSSAPLTTPSPHAPLPATAAEFADQVLARHPRSAFTPTFSGRSDPAGQTSGGQAPQPVPAPQAAETPVNCDSDAVL
jgi:hypothetical protein